MPTESINQDHVCQATIAVGKPQQTKVAGVQERGMPYEPPQTSCAWLAANLHNRRAFAIHINHGHPRAAWLTATTSRQVGATCSLRRLCRGMLAVWGPCALPGPERQAPWELEAVMLRGGKPMFWEFLAQRILRHRPFRRRTVPPIKTVTHEPPCDRALAETYFAHVAVHGPHKLLPQDVLPSPPSCHEREKPQAAPE
jgi:hypothetical protein